MQLTWQSKQCITDINQYSERKYDGIYVSQSQAMIALWVGIQETHDGLEDDHKCIRYELRYVGGDIMNECKL